MRWATRQRCGKGTLARPDGIPTLARGNENIFYYDTGKVFSGLNIFGQEECQLYF